MTIELFAVRRGGFDNETVKALIRHGVLIPIAVTITEEPTLPIDKTTKSVVDFRGHTDVPDVDWTGGKG